MGKIVINVNHPIPPGYRMRAESTTDKVNLDANGRIEVEEEHGRTIIPWSNVSAVTVHTDEASSSPQE